MEHWEAVLYKNAIIAESGEIEKALEHLDAVGKRSPDVLGVMEMRAPDSSEYVTSYLISNLHKFFSIWSEGGGVFLEFVLPWIANHNLFLLKLPVRDIVRAYNLTLETKQSSLGFPFDLSYSILGSLWAGMLLDYAAKIKSV